MVVLPGLMLAMVLAMLDNMIVGTAMPRIVNELGGLAHLSWVVTAYVLGTTVSTPIWGKIGDLYGRKNIFLASIVLFMIGSVLCGMAGSDLLGGPSGGMTQLIAFRALQGLGAGGLMVNAMAIIGDLVPPRERGQYQGIMAAVMSLAMIAGPLVGGFITDHLDWRWAFYVNLPVGFVALALLAAKLKLPRLRTEHRIDWTGAALLSIGITALVLITTWGGNDYAWGSPQILALTAVAVVSLALFVPVERRAAEPIMPLGLFRNRNFTLVSLVGFLLGFAMFGAINFLPLFQQTVQGASATNSGLLLLPMMGSAMAVSLFVGRAITATGRYKVYPVLGGVIMTVAMWLLSMMDAHTPAWQTGVFIAVLGLGMGFLMQTTMLIAQNSVEQKDLGVSSSASTFFRSIGGSFGVSLFGAVFNNRLSSSLESKLGAEGGKLASSGGQFDPAALERLPANVRAGFLDSLAFAISEVFWWAILFAVLVPVFAVFIKEIPLRGGPEQAAKAEPPVAVD
ncbi:EmrB/QacA subfamily drug resistance transporter [Streptosporangium becharense]|uniref:EmrB/QacA subfamily drug resistance transporter n=2 Tax=Streptosporangium becharense TaxID=1816182 RepID=A0A7W9ME74_9ACTN|nr:MDR family MFS transporter [Streptosporangium becharense]MBB2913596.1 EmrB/QacA subfamily drug resistance transporter [Streptosporangium becharense]MBB5817677.1 EmrB/QacA subfamily drug resistance transporter [Streptosporangium becharense]